MQRCQHRHVTTDVDLRPLYLAGCEAVLAALRAPEVALGWDRPSVLEDQPVGSLAGHLARGAIWLVGDYLRGPEPTGPADFTDAAEYFSVLVAASTPADDAAVRARGAQVAAAGHAALVEEVTDRLPAMRARLDAADPARLVTVFGGRSMSLGAYLATRVVEQVVHLDDLARSLDCPPVALPDGSVEIALDVALRIARIRSGDSALVRALYRQGFAEAVLPVL